MSTDNTGLVLSKVRGPLNNLLDNLSGDHADYWLRALKKMLRKEELPMPPKEVQEFLEKLESKEILRQKLNEWISFLEKIPVVVKVEETNPEDTDLLCIFFYQTTSLFLKAEKDSMTDFGMFMLKSDGTVYLLNDFENNVLDKVYKKWRKEEYSNLHEFSKALLELGNLYQSGVSNL
jgi:hypothetical protein